MALSSITRALLSSVALRSTRELMFISILFFLLSQFLIEKKKNYIFYSKKVYKKLLWYRLHQILSKIKISEKNILLMRFYKENKKKENSNLVIAYHKPQNGQVYIKII